MVGLDVQHGRAVDQVNAREPQRARVRAHRVDAGEGQADWVDAVRGPKWGKVEIDYTY